ncbi:hotdog fold thioesterase [Georgenia satyanarayanai]|uniref:PaaI family thioesterase n=1 Tax=Georgenia satyanarayanai TaxID=860221 RepID=UPI00203CE78A|nr:hotdog fold thioesterase [Georgenia satyanarayanai]MCM3660047.1 hotdog fold thioesterase [Georgenia satyanarayanai]
MTSTDPDLLARLQDSVGDLGTLTQRLGIELLTVSSERVSARMPVEGNTQVVGLLHGGASAALAETVGSVAATLHAGAGRGAVGVDLSATHHRAVRSGFVTAVATPLHLGGRLATYDVTITDEDGRRVCTARLTCMLVDRT